MRESESFVPANRKRYDVAVATYRNAVARMHKALDAYINCMTDANKETHSRLVSLTKRALARMLKARERFIAEGGIIS